MKKIVRVTAFIMMMAMLFDSSAMIAFASTAESEATLKAAVSVINEYVGYLDSGEVENILDIMSEQRRIEDEEFILNEENKVGHVGYFNYESAQLVSIQEYKDDWKVFGYSEQEYANISEITAWDCIINVETYRDTDFLLEGNNRFVITVGKDEAGKFVIVGIVRDKLWSESEENLLGNAVMTLESDGWEYAPVGNTSGGTWTNPSAIVVWMGDGVATETVDFKEYCYKVLQSEFGSDSYHDEARKAAAMTVKMVGWHSIVVQRYTGEEYHVKYNDEQVYDKNKTPTSSVKYAVNSIWNYMMLTCDYKIFYSYYVSSSAKSPYAVYHGGVYSQIEANTLAEAEEYQGNYVDWMFLLHYYYDYGRRNSDVTQGVIKIIPVSHGPVYGSTYESDASGHWKVCTICGCAHTTSSHSYTIVNGKCVCSVCGYIN